MDTKKRLSDWTLAECKEYCINRCKQSSPCDGCILSETICAGDVCKEWTFETLTDGEKAIMRACGAKWVTKNHADSALVELFEQKPYRKEGGYYDGKNCIGSLDSKLFPSVSGGECIELED